MENSMSEIVKYGATFKWLHWFIGIVVILMLIFGRSLESLPLSEREQIIMGHSGLGTIVLLLMLLRWGWRLTHEPPGALETMTVFQTRASKIMHWTLYVLLLLQPVFGIFQAMFITDYQVIAFGVIDYSGLAAADEGMEKIFHVLHGVTATVISVLVIGHIGAAFYHHFHQKDSVMKRMIPFGKP